MNTHLRCGLLVAWAYLGLTLCARADPEETYELVRQARSMSPQQAKGLEELANQRPDDLPTRSKLLFYYAFLRDQAAATPHYLWIVEHHPEAAILDNVVYTIEAVQDEGKRQARALWRKHVEDHPDDIMILRNAERALESVDGEIAVLLLQHLAALDSKNSEWPGRLGRLYSYSVREDDGSIDVEAAKRSLGEYEQALSVTKACERFFILENVATAALLAGNGERAKQYAIELLDRAVEAPPGWNYGNAVHHGNLILGHLALREGRVEEAEDFLIRAGKTPGSPQLNSFGPNMRLALELLQKGRKDRVLEYLRLCQTFWNGAKLADWIKIVETGGIPDFGGNLDY